MKKNTKMYSTAIAAALATSTLVSVVPTQAESVTFKDVDKSSQFYNYIANLAERGVVQGDGTGFFHPKQDVRRDHAAKIIAGILDLNTTNVVNPNFKDVPTNHPQYGAIAALKEAGIISGDGYGNYLPEKSLTRGEMAKIIANALELEVATDATTPFTDVKGNMFEKYITALYVNGVTNGVGNNKFDPSGVVTREQLAAFVVRGEETPIHPTTPPSETTPTVSAFFNKVNTAMEVVDAAVSQVDVTATPVAANQFKVVINQVAGTTITKTDILNQKQKVLDEFTRQGLRTEVTKVNVGGTDYLPSDFASATATSLFAIAPALVEDLGLTINEAAELLDADNTVDLVSLLTKSQYKLATPIVVTLSNGDTCTVTTELNLIK